MNSSSHLEGELPIVLTATILPNATNVPTTSAEARLAEYVQALIFYQPFAPIFFLENSSYPLGTRAELFKMPQVTLRRFPLSANPERGKGYQEFEMLDSWLASEPDAPSRWLKITGRYQVLNIRTILAECGRRPAPGILIDQAPRTGVARTHLFCVSTAFYMQRLAGRYRKCDDRTGDWIERVLFRELKGGAKDEVTSFATQPRISAVAGSTGAAFPVGRSQWVLKQALRSVNRLFDPQYLWYAK